ncbi:MAG: 1-deoxy-D-xylulose-5-phosphate reductoisomerase [Holosporales bacterium]|jgi:1-deoxy-D-xylulose-5-phosphate reductoisomerase|nr:1-deoxy-D-xylulose-5-phosphate reductoisomerase [Holosporales bacterium]
MKICSIFGSTGTIGRKALKVAEDSGFEIAAITGCTNSTLLINQALKYRPKYVGIANDENYVIVKEALSGEKIEVISGREIDELAKMDVHCCVMSMAGTTAGIGPTFACLGHAKRLAIASKEPIIIGGTLLRTMAEHKGTEILPIDSEHSAIFQCLLGEDKRSIERLILTASGGPFWDIDGSELDTRATIEASLNHPKWKMGTKISIDSATMINKAFEIIEAAILFDINIDKIISIIHPEAVVHGLIEFADGNVKAILSVPEMILPISYALNYPYRNCSNYKNFDLSKVGMLNFIVQKDWQRKNINLGYIAFRENKTIALTIADALAVDRFVKGQIGFTQIYRLILKILEESLPEKIEAYEDIQSVITEYLLKYG